MPVPDGVVPSATTIPPPPPPPPPALQEFGIPTCSNEGDSFPPKLQEFSTLISNNMSLFSTLRPNCSESAPSVDPLLFQLLLDSQTNRPSPKWKRPKTYGKLSLDAKKQPSSKKKKGRKMLTYLKPGALAQLRDAQRNARYSCCAKKSSSSSRSTDGGLESLFATRGDHHAAVQPSMPNEVTPGPSVRVFGPVCPQRKKLLAPKTPATSVSASQTPTLSPPNDPPNESRLESLPLELLVRIICNLHHDQLKPTFHVCRRLRQAVLIARRCHFDFTTPNRDRQEAVSLSFMRSVAANGPSTRPPTPQAPRPPPKLAQARISLADIKHFAVPLFQSTASRSRHAKSASMRRFAVRAAPSHRALFYEEELCQAVAQNSI